MSADDTDCTIHCHIAVAVQLVVGFCSKPLQHPLLKQLLQTASVLLWLTPYDQLHN